MWKKWVYVQNEAKAELGKNSILVDNPGYGEGAKKEIVRDSRIRNRPDITLGGVPAHCAKNLIGIGLK